MGKNMISVKAQLELPKSMYVSIAALILALYAVVKNRKPGPEGPIGAPGPPGPMGPAKWLDNDRIPPYATKTDPVSPPAKPPWIECVEHRQRVILSVTPDGEYIMHDGGSLCDSEMFVVDNFGFDRFSVHIPSVFASTGRVRCRRDDKEVVVTDFESIYHLDTVSECSSSEFYFGSTFFNRQDIRLELPARTR